MICADFPETWPLNLTECQLSSKSTTGKDAQFGIHRFNKHTNTPIIVKYKTYLTQEVDSFFFPSLSLQASRECQSKQKQLEQGFRSAFREFQQWLVNAKINTAKCFDVPQNLTEASASLLKIQVQCIELNSQLH